MLFAIFLELKRFSVSSEFQKKMVQFCYLRLYFGIDIVSQQTRYSTWFMVGHA